MGEPRVCDLGCFGVVGADWCLGWKEGRNLGFVIWGFGVVEVGRERLNLGDCFCWWGIVDRVSSDRRFFGGEQPSDLRGGRFCMETRSCKWAKASSAALSSAPTTRSSKRPRISSSSSTIPTPTPTLQ